MSFRCRLNLQPMSRVEVPRGKNFWPPTNQRLQIKCFRGGEVMTGIDYPNDGLFWWSWRYSCFQVEVFTLKSSGPIGGPHGKLRYLLSGCNSRSFRKDADSTRAPQRFKAPQKCGYDLPITALVKPVIRILHHRNHWI
jgi:hypothetical protein